MTNSPPATPPVVAGLIIDYLSPDLTISAIKSMDAFLSNDSRIAEIVVVDNGASESGVLRERLAQLATATPVQFLPQSRNSGFAGAAKVGVESTAAEWIFFLNNDARVLQGSLSDLLAPAAQHDRVGALVPLMVFESDPSRVNSAGVSVDQHGVARDSGIGSPTTSFGDLPFEVWGGSGGATLYSRAMLQEIGSFEADFFMYYEDVDVAWRAKAHGWKTYCVPAVRVSHMLSGSTSHESDFKLYWSGRNRVRLIARNMRRQDLLRAATSLAVYELAYVAYYLLFRRTSAPLKGRLAGLRRWRADRNSVRRAAVELESPTGIVGALRRNRDVRAYRSAS